MVSTRRFLPRLTEALANPRFWKIVLFAAAVAGPLLLLVFLICRDHVEIPYWDQWEFAKLLAKYHRRGLAFEDFWAQHNEHRLLLPRLLMFLLALATGWNIGVELAFNVGLAAAVLIVVGCQLRLTRRLVPAFNIALLIPLLSLLHFAYSQAENWLWGWQIAIFLNLLAVVSAIVLLCRPRLTWGRLFCGFGLALAALCSFGNGALTFGLGVLLPFRSDLDRRAKTAMLAFWAMGSGLAMGGYLYGFVPSQTLLPWSLQVVDNPKQFLDFVLVLLGYPMAGGNLSIAVWTGSAGLGLFGALVLYLVSVERLDWTTLSPYVCFGGYPLASAVLIALGRNGLGLQQAAAPRYIAFGNLLWMADLCLLFMALAVSKRPKRIAGWVVAPLALAMAVGVIGSSLAGSRYGERHRARLAAVREDILRHGPEGFDLDLAAGAYPDPRQIKSMRLLQMMQEQGYSLFAGEEAEPTKKKEQPVPPSSK